MADKDRLSSAYIPGNHNRPPGTSVLLHGTVVSKSDPSCHIQGQTEEVRHDVGQILCYLNSNPSIKIPNTLLTVLEWLGKNIFSFASYCFMKGNSIDHAFTLNTLTELDLLYSSYKDECETKNSDFLFYTDYFCLLIDKLRISVRKLESDYWAWSEDSRVVLHVRSHMVKDPKGSLMKMESIVVQGNILNRLSSVLYQGNKLTYELNNPVNNKIVQWSGKAEDLII